MEPKYTVLLLEDDEDDYFLMQCYLEGVSCCKVTLDWIDRYDKALKYMEESPPDLLLVDYNLNHAKNGIDFVREIRKSGNDTPAVLVTGMDKDDLGGDKVIDIVDEYLSKRELTEAVLEETLCPMLVGDPEG